MDLLFRSSLGLRVQGLGGSPPSAIVTRTDSGDSLHSLASESRDLCARPNQAL